MAYLPYGGVRLGDASTLPTDYGFTGQRLEAGLGLMHYGARFYSPRLGRFVSADTIVPEPGEPQALNRYAYVLNNPVIYRDPSGHDPWWDCPGPACIEPVSSPPPESWGRWDVAITVLTFDIFAMQDWGPGQPRGTTTRWMQEQFEEAQAWQRRNIRDPMDARVPVLKTIDGLSQTPEFQMGLMAAMMTANTFAPAVKPYEVGQVDDLRNRSVGDKLDIHHVPQAHPAEQVIPGYDPLKGPGIALPQPEHQVIPTESGPYTGTPRDLVAGDLWKLRQYTGAPNSALQDLLDLIRQIYPGALDK